MNLMLGSGKVPGGEGWVNVDIEDFGNNVIHDLQECPWPFEDDAFEHIEGIDVMEHMFNLKDAVNEMIRVGKPGCTYKIQVPSAEFPEAVWTDPEHWHGFAPRSFDYWQRGNNLCDHYGLSKNKGRFYIENIKVEKLNFNLVFTFTKANA